MHVFYENLATDDAIEIEQLSRLMYEIRVSRDALLAQLGAASPEQALARLEGISDVAVIGVPDERMGEVGKAVVVRSDDALTAEAVIAFARERLANFKVPRLVTFVDTLPRNLSGKVLKTALRED